MGNFGELKKISRLEKETKSGNQKAKEELEKMKVAIKNVEFRFTDKKIDLEELYKENVIDKKSSRIGFIFNKNYGILSSNNIDIKKDRFGRDVIDYSAKNSFVNRVNKKYNDELRKSEKSNEKFNQELQRGVNEISVENREEQSEKSIEENLVVK